MFDNLEEGTTHAESEDLGHWAAAVRQRIAHLTGPRAYVGLSFGAAVDEDG